jgi:hypothetical protein
MGYLSSLAHGIKYKVFENAVKDVLAEEECKCD